MRSRKRNSLPHSRVLFLIFLLPALVCWRASAQDWVRTGTNLGAARIRLAAADFNPSSSDAQTPALKTTFDNTLYSDLNSAGIFDMVSKSMAPPVMPASPQQMNLAQWAAAPANAAFVAFGSISTAGDRLAVYGWLFDAKNPASPQILGKQYNEAASQDNARLIAHRFADEIITRLGGGIPGIAETHIYYIAARGGNKEVWQMDYDGQGQHQVTHLGTISLSPRVSPDNDRIAFASLGKLGWSIRMYSLVLGRMISFSSMVGNTLSPLGRATAQSWPSPPPALAIPRFLPPMRAVATLSRSQPLGAGCFAYLEPQDQLPDRMVQRPYRPAADLHHVVGWNWCAAHDRRRIRDLTLLVAQRTVSGLCLESQIWSWRAWRTGHLHHGHCQQALDTAYA